MDTSKREGLVALVASTAVVLVVLAGHYVERRRGAIRAPVDTVASSAALATSATTTSRIGSAQDRALGELGVEVADGAAPIASPRDDGAAPTASPSGNGAAPSASTLSTGDAAPPSVARVQTGPARMLHLDAHHTNRSPFVGPTHPTLAWTFDTGGPIEAAPVVLDDGTIVTSSLSGKLFAIEPGGKLRFSVDLGGRGYGSPLVAGEGIVVGSDAQKIFGISTSGAVRWRLDTDADADTALVPLLDRGFVVASGRVVYGVRKDGTLLWRVRTRAKTYTAPAVADDGATYVGSQDHRLYAIEPDGRVRFRVDLGADVDGSPAIADDGRVFVGTDGREVVAVAPNDGAIVWRREVGGFVRGCLSVTRRGRVLAGTYGPSPRIVALEPGDGAIAWAFAIQGTGAPEFGIHGAPVEDAHGTLYFGAQDDAIYALDGSGKLLWKWKTGGDVDSPLVVTADGTLLAGSDDGKLYGLRDP